MSCKVGVRLGTVKDTCPVGKTGFLWGDEWGRYRSYPGERHSVVVGPYRDSRREKDGDDNGNTQIRTLVIHEEFPFLTQVQGQRRGPR